MADKDGLRLGVGKGRPMTDRDEIAADQRHKDVLEAIGGLKGEIDRLEPQLAELAVEVEARGKLIDKIAVGLGIEIDG
jgi:hypothetical protein